MAGTPGDVAAQTVAPPGVPVTACDLVAIGHGARLWSNTTANRANMGNRANATTATNGRRANDDDTDTRLWIRRLARRAGDGACGECRCACRGECRHPQNGDKQQPFQHGFPLSLSSVTKNPSGAF